MILQALKSGELKIDSDTLIEFKNGIPGFEEYKFYYLVSMQDSPFLYLQSKENENLVFIVANPFDFFREYEFDLQEYIVTELEISDPKQVFVLNVITIKDELVSATMNLAAPIVINVENNQGMQYILPYSRYDLRQPLFTAMIVTKGGL